MVSVTVHEVAVGQPAVAPVAVFTARLKRSDVTTAHKHEVNCTKVGVIKINSPVTDRISNIAGCNVYAWL
jgi:hypothetical protein